MLFSFVRVMFLFFFAIVISVGQRPASLLIYPNSFSQFLRTVLPVPEGRSATLKDVYIRYYVFSHRDGSILIGCSGHVVLVASVKSIFYYLITDAKSLRTNITNPKSYTLHGIKELLTESSFDVQKPTVLYVHGFVELAEDDSVTTVIKAYIENGTYNILLLDWSNFGFGSYVKVSLTIRRIGLQTAKALRKLLDQGLPLDRLHLVGHSLGAHMVGIMARQMLSQGVELPRITGLDPAYPGFYPPILDLPISAKDARFVDIIHTDGGQYGGPEKTGHADFWPNAGQGKQPGCISYTLPFSTEDFCSHWRSWTFWAESVTGGEFLARKCSNYDNFLRGKCQEASLVYMGLKSTPNLHGNFYLRTAAKSPYALGEKGAM